MVSRNVWLSLPQTTRKGIALLLDIPRSGGTEVADNRVVHDGYTDRDLACLTLERLQEFMQLPDETDFYKLLSMLADRIENPVNIEKKEVPKKIINKE